MGNGDWKPEIQENFLPPTANSAKSVLRGCIRYIRTVHSVRRKDDERFHSNSPVLLDRREKEFIAHLKFSKYQFPSDIVDIEVPGIPEEEIDSDIDDFPTSSATREKATPVVSEADRSRLSALRERRRMIQDA